MNNTSKEDKPSLISTAVGFVAIMSAVNIVISVLFEIGYYHRGLGIDIPSIPTTMSDHIKACFMWLPLFLSLLAAACIGIITAIVKTKNSNNENGINIHHELTILQALKPSKYFIFFTLILILLAIVSYLNTHKFFHVWYFVILVLLQLYNHIISALHILYFKKIKYRMHWYYIASGVPYIIIMTILAGYYSARLDIDSKKYVYEIILKDPSAHKIKANVLRSYDKATFFVYSSQKLVFIQNDQIKMITKQ